MATAGKAIGSGLWRNSVFWTHRPLPVRQSAVAYGETQFFWTHRPLPVRQSAVAYGETQFSELKNSFWTLTLKQAHRIHVFSRLSAWPQNQSASCKDFEDKCSTEVLYGPGEFGCVWTYTYLTGILCKKLVMIHCIDPWYVYCFPV